MPFTETIVNRVLSVKKLDLRECSSFALNALFSFFLDRSKQIDEISIVQCTMSPYDSPAHGSQYMKLGNPIVLKIKKSLLPFDPQEYADQSLDSLLGLSLANVKKLVLHDLMIKEDEIAYEHKFTRHSIVSKFIGGRDLDLQCLTHLDISKNRLTL